MDRRIGLFGQVKYVFKGLTKPRFFNRLANQSVFCMVVYTIFTTILCAAVFWGIMYLRCLGKGGLVDNVVDTIKNVPQFSYESGQVTFEENTFLKVGDKLYLVFNSDVVDSDANYKGKVEILTDWRIGNITVAFNQKSFTVIGPLPKISPKFKYSDLVSAIQLPSSFNREKLQVSFKTNFWMYFLVVAGVSLIPFAIKAVALAFLFGLLGFGVNKIIKQPYNYKEMVRMSLYITGITNIVRAAINASPVRPPWMVLNVAFILIVGIYLFFALAGATEETGPSSTIVFNKPSSGRFSDDIPAPDPFARKNYAAGGFSRKTETAVEKENVKAVSPAPSITATTLFTPKKEETVSETPSGYTTETPAPSNISSFIDLHTKNTSVETQPAETYAEPETASYSEPAVSYSEPEVPYSEPAVSYSEPEPAPAPSAVVKSDLGTFGGLGGIRVSDGVSTTKKSKPKYDRPITAPDAYNGLYYSGSDSEESYESNYGSGSLADRGGLYGKTIGSSETSDNPFASVLGAKPAASAPSTMFSVSQGSATTSGAGGSLYSAHIENHSTEHLSFTTKEGNNPFGGNNGFYLSAPPKKGTPRPATTVKKGGKKVTIYSDDDFAAWERENYADEPGPRRYGNNIF